MSNQLDSEPWRGLPAEVADLIEPELPPITEEILATIAREVPEYARPLKGRFGRGIRSGVGEALQQFVALIRDPGAGRGQGREVYVELGRGEQRVGRTLDSLQAAYRLGARVAWRRFAEAGQRAGLEPQPLTLLADAIFAYIDELSADSVEGYAEAQAAVEDLRRRRRQELVTLLLSDPPAAAADLAAIAEEVGWKLPRRLAVAACAEDDLGTLTGRLPVDLLVTAVQGSGCIVVPDPEGPGRREELQRLAARAAIALGPTVETAQAPRSWQLATALLRAAGESMVLLSSISGQRNHDREGLLLAEDHLPDLLLAGAPTIVSLLAERRLAPLRDLTPRARERMRETALAYVRHHGNAVAMAEELHVHPQTARYRIARLRELFGEELDDPDVRFELEIALRAGAA